MRKELRSRTASIWGTLVERGSQMRAMPLVAVALFTMTILSGCVAFDSGIGEPNMKNREPSAVVVDEVLDLCKSAEEQQMFGGPHPDFVFHFIQMRAAGWDTMDLDTMVAVSGASGLFAFQEGTFFTKYFFRHIDMEKRIEEVTKRLEGEGSIGACRGRKLRS